MGQRFRRGLGGALIGTALSYPVAEAYTDENLVEMAFESVKPGYLTTYDNEDISELNEYGALFLIENDEEIYNVIEFTNDVLTSLG